MGLDPASSLSTKVDELPRQCQWQPVPCKWLTAYGGLCRSLWWPLWWLVVASVAAYLWWSLRWLLWCPWLVLAATPSCQPAAIKEPATQLVGRGIKGSKGQRSSRDGVGGGAMRSAREFCGEAEGTEGYGVELAGAGGRAAAARIGVVRAGDGAADVARGGAAGGATGVGAREARRRSSRCVGASSSTTESLGDSQARAGQTRGHMGDVQRRRRRCREAAEGEGEGDQPPI
jgi:hypothetical protein